MDVASAIRTIKERLNIADVIRRYVELRPNGARLVAPCPFHQETKPSFSVDPERGFFHCFGCQASGDIFEFYSRINGLEFRETLEQLAEEAGIQIDSFSVAKRPDQRRQELSLKKIMHQMHDIAARFFSACLEKPDAADCRAYIEKRGLSRDILLQFGLGWSPAGWHGLLEQFKKHGFKLNQAVEAGLLSVSESGNFYDRFRKRLMFPIKNLSNQITAFGGRIIEQVDEAKYINSADTPIYKKKEHLYGLAQARRGIASRGQAIITEGYMDVLTLHQFGYDNSVGVLGTALTEEQIKRLSGFTSNILLLFDGDRAGRKAALRSGEMLLSRGLGCKIASLPEGEDIDSLLRSAGKEAFDEITARAKPALQYCVEVLKTLAPREGVDWARNFLSRIRMPELCSSYASQLARHLGIDEKILREEAAQAPGSSAFTKRVNQPALRQLLNMRDTQIMIFAVRYPDRLQDLRDMGADMALTTPQAREFWDLIEQWGPEEVVYHLSDRQKNFWNSQRMPPAAPLTDVDNELECLRNDLAAYYRSSQQASLTAAMCAQETDTSFESDLDYLRALQETLEKTNEQS